MIDISLNILLFGSCDTISVGPFLFPVRGIPNEPFWLAKRPKMIKYHQLKGTVKGIVHFFCSTWSSRLYQLLELFYSIYNSEILKSKKHFTVFHFYKKGFCLTWLLNSPRDAKSTNYANRVFKPYKSHKVCWLGNTECLIWILIKTN